MTTTDRPTASTITDAQLDELYAERDRARRVAVRLENECARLEGLLAAIRTLHQPAPRDWQRICATCSGWDGFRCRGLVTPWPCPTIAVIDTEPAAPAAEEPPPCTS